MATRMERSLRRVDGAMGTVLRTAGGFALAQVGIAGLSGAFGAIQRSVIGLNATLETAELQFGTLLGSADKARAHVQSLFRFAAETPFETGPILQASRMLLTFGIEAERSERVLRLVGDAAAVSGANIAEVARWFGRASSAIQAGRPFGEAAQRLQELGIMSAEGRNRIEDLIKSGASAVTIYAELERQFERFHGAMKLQAGTWSGLVSTITDNLQLVTATAFRPFFDVLKEMATRIAAAVQTEEFSSRMADLGQRVFKFFSELALTVARFIDTIQPVVARIFDVIASAWERFQQLPAIVQSVGIVGVFIGGLKGAIALAGILHLVNRIGKSLEAIEKGMPIKEFIFANPEDIDRFLAEVKILEGAGAEIDIRVKAPEGSAERMVQDLIESARQAAQKTAAITVPLQVTGGGARDFGQGEVFEGILSRSERLRELAATPLRDLKDELADMDEQLAALDVSSTLFATHGLGGLRLSLGASDEEVVTFGDSVFRASEVIDLMGGTIVSRTDDLEAWWAKMKAAESTLVDLDSSLGLINKQAQVFGESFDANTATVHAYQAAITDLLSQGLDPLDARIQRLKGRLADASKAVDEQQKKQQLIADATDIVTHSASSVADALADMATGGKASFKELAEAVIKDITRMLIKLAILRAVRIGLSFLPGGSTANAASDIAAAVPATASGGIVTRSQIRRVGEAGPEAIIPLDRLGGMASGGMTVVNEIHNHTDARVQTRQRQAPDGRMINEIIINTVRTALGEGKFDKEGTRLGWRPVGVAR